MIFGITLILLGILAVPSLILSKKPEAKELLDKIIPYQGWIGLVACLWGVWGIISCVLNIGIIAYWPLWWATWLVCVVLLAALGFILGYGMINMYLLSKNEEAKKKGEAVLAKLVPFQGKLGIVAIIVGIWAVLANLLFLG